MKERKINVEGGEKMNQNTRIMKTVLRKEMIMNRQTKKEKIGDRRRWIKKKCKKEKGKRKEKINRNVRPIKVVGRKRTKTGRWGKKWKKRDRVIENKKKEMKRKMTKRGYRRKRKEIFKNMELRDEKK